MLIVSAGPSAAEIRSSGSVGADIGSASAGSEGSASTGSWRLPTKSSDNYGDGCPDILVVAVSGATDSSADRDPFDDKRAVPWSNWLANITVPLGEANRDRPGAVGWMYVPYPSTYGLGLLTDVPTYQDSVAAGVASTNRILNEKKTQCAGATEFVLLGYSVGGEVVERVARELGHRGPSALVTADDIAGVALIGDPYRPAGTPSLDGAGPSGGGFMSSEPADYGSLEGKILSVCRPYDIACDAPQQIALLELALGVLGQVRFTLLDPIQTVADLDRVVSEMRARTLAHIAARSGWFTSDESLLDVLRKVADRTYRDDAAEAVTPEQIAAMVAWMNGPGAGVVRAKLRADGPGFVADNSGIVDLILGPYILLGPLQHAFYWNDNPDDPWYWDSEQIVDWITELAGGQPSGAGGAGSTGSGSARSMNTGS
ncbi:cutinase family protein [Rhodococcus sp. ABRD24]|nr:cutinase family protein [Rhodococcus sp. ABRD24]